MSGIEGIVSRGKIVFDCWDFAGQEVFYATHQYFISRRAIYLVIYNAANAINDRDLKKISYWFNTVRTLADKRSPIVFVGTHCDLPVCTPVKLEELKGILENTFGRHVKVPLFSILE